MHTWHMYTHTQVWAHPAVQKSVGRGNCVGTKVSRYTGNRQQDDDLRGNPSKPT